MIELLDFYKWTLICAMSFGPLLALIGMQLASRDQAVLTVCSSQAAVLGVLIGLASNVFFEISGSINSLQPMLMGVVAMSICHAILLRKAKNFGVSKSTFYISVYVLLLSSCSILTALVPTLESHLSQRFFGDLATVMDHEAKAGLILSLLCLCYLVMSWKALVRFSFETMVLNFKRQQNHVGFLVVQILAISFSVMIFGLIFTLGSLFMGTCFAKICQSRTLRNHALTAYVLTLSSIGIGFVLSLAFPRLSTVPIILLINAFLGFCLTKFSRCAKCIII